MCRLCGHTLTLEGVLSVCGHLMKVCGRTPSWVEEHEEHYEFEVWIQVFYLYEKLNDDVLHVLEAF